MRVLGSMSLILISVSAATASPNFEARHSRALARLKQHSTTAPRITWSAETQRPQAIRRLDVDVPGASHEAKAREFFKRHGDLLAPKARLRLLRTRSTRSRTILRFAQTLNKLVVHQAQLVVVFDAQSHIRAVHSSLVEPVGSLAKTPAIDQSYAILSAQARTKGSGQNATKGQVTAMFVKHAGKLTLAYRVFLPLTADPRGRAHFVDATTGQYLKAQAGIIWEGRGLR